MTHAVGFQYSPSYLAHGLQLVVVLLVVVVVVGRRRLVGPREPHFGQVAREYFHDAVRLRMVVYGRPVALAPAQHHQVELAVARVHQVPGVPELVELGVLEPLGRVAAVRLHQVLHVLDVHAVLREHPVQLVHQVAEPEPGRVPAAPTGHRGLDGPVHVGGQVPVAAVSLYGAHGRTAVVVVVPRSQPVAPRPLGGPREPRVHRRPFRGSVLPLGARSLQLVARAFHDGGLVPQWLHYAEYPCNGTAFHVNISDNNALSTKNVRAYSRWVPALTRASEHHVRGCDIARVLLRARNKMTISHVYFNDSVILYIYDGAAVYRSSACGVVPVVIGPAGKRTGFYIARPSCTAPPTPLTGVIF